MSQQCILKICLKSDKVILEPFKILLSFVQKVDRIYYNIYKKEYRSGVRYENITEMQPYSREVALKILKKRLKGNFPFFLDIYGVEEEKEKEAFTLARTGEFTFLYIILSEENFVERRELLFFILEKLITADIMIMGSCSDIADGIEIGEEQNVLSNWQWQRRKIYAKYNNPNYDLTIERTLLNCDTIWYSVGCFNWYNLNYLTENNRRLLLKYTNCFSKEVIGKNGIILQNYDERKNYGLYKNRIICENLSEYLYNNKFFINIVKM